MRTTAPRPLPASRVRPVGLGGSERARPGSKPWRTVRRLLATLAAAALLAPALSGTSYADEDDPALKQKIDPNQAQGTGQVVRDAGHVDVGPTLNTGGWRIQIHDDTSVPAFWRALDDVVLQVNDHAIQQVPEGDAYAFLGQEPGTDAWIIPQVQKPDVIWAGWNTQEQNVLDTLNRGVTLRMLGVEGPGELTVFLQTGNFGDVLVLYSTRQPFPQESWIEVNTHTHANWVFSEPGVYLVEVEFAGQLISGETVSARDTLRFSVGDQTDPQTAFAMTISDAAVSDPTAAPTSQPAPEPTDDGGLGTLIWVGAGAVLAALLVAVVVVAVTTSRAKARARAAVRRDEEE